MNNFNFADLIHNVSPAEFDSDLPVLYQDEFLVAINKPAGLLVHRSDIDRHETRFAVQLLRDQLGQKVFPLHRLDKPTAGVLVFGLNPEIARKMMTIFMADSVEKTYLAVVRGYSAERAMIDYPLQEQLDKMTDRLAQQDKAAQVAITHYQRLATVELPFAVGRYPSSRYSLLQLSPKTGRKHQLRRHLKHVFHPIIGDTTHGDGKHNDFFRRQLNCRQLLLASTQLNFLHPVTGQMLEIKAPLDAGFSRIVTGLNWNMDNAVNCNL
ncbi:tRNA pseudouridine(65) synthase TruC [Methylobacter sp.]|uniref:tRNA pseudouridine(65) synthase TruC n=1 Tax=Methylobacter sp. TaxID=2051955 RepID=UPI002487359C|nr:tRNA pseudouridine(65) synthase TruC [Methylobacter sp.]MDI1277825.1 tRNA pseudouridine(65) synthase TruC [Methylobacter sp.]MDI1358493.1 tRNA pseudouridine(65) synthase TruC [Methylobacter sp.]